MLMSKRLPTSFPIFSFDFLFNSYLEFPGNRTGTLCGECEDNFALEIDGCKQCPSGVSFDTYFFPCMSIYIFAHVHICISYVHRSMYICIYIPVNVYI